MQESVSLTEATTSITPIPSHRPDAKTRRYDRQLRLWATSGQSSLESSKVLLIGSDHAGCQALKNLILPGINGFDVMSDKEVGVRDIAGNFFLEPESLGLGWAGEVVRLLTELNPSVKGTPLPLSPLTTLNSNPESFLVYSLIICTNVDPAFERTLSQFLWERSGKGERDVPLISIRTSGFVARIRTQYREHCVIDTHPDHQHTLRLDTPFPALQEYADGLDLEKMDSMEHGHIPFVLLLIRALKVFRGENDSARPVYADLDKFKEILLRDRRSVEEENYAEAEGQAFAVTQISEVPDGIRGLMSDDACQGVTKESKDFWLLLKALHDYTSHPSNPSGLLPISSSLPDMHTSTASYIALQKLYKDKAREDLELFRQCLQDVLKDVGLDEEAIGAEDVEAFVKHCHTLLCERGNRLKEELEEGDVAGDFLTESFDQTHGVAINIAFHLAEKHQFKTGHWPGTVEDEYHTVKAQMFDRARRILGMPTLGENVDRDEDGKLMVKPSREDDEMEEETEEEMDRQEETKKAKILQDSIDEVCRGGMSVLPTTAALVGGLVAQEGIKLITNQYGPLNGTCVVDLVKGGMTRYKV